MSRGVGDSSGGSFGFELLRGTGPGVMAIASRNRIDDKLLGSTVGRTSHVLVWRRRKNMCSSTSFSFFVEKHGKGVGDAMFAMVHAWIQSSKKHGGSQHHITNLADLL